jgi:hypothetical protein
MCFVVLCNLLISTCTELIIMYDFAFSHCNAYELSHTYTLINAPTLLNATVYAFFLARVRANLHVVLSMDPHNPQFTTRCESNPAIYTCCTTVWMGTWSRQVRCTAVCVVMFSVKHTHIHACIHTNTRLYVSACTGYGGRA